MRYVSTHQAMEQLDGDHDDGDGHGDDQALKLRKKRKRKIKWAQGKGILDRAILFLALKTP